MFFDRINVFKLMTLAFYVSATFAKDGPQLVGAGANVTVVEGRDATLTCRVLNLQKYKVAWLRVDTQTILTIGPHVITKNHRVGVTRGDPQVWALTLRDVRLADGGHYMCQINTEPMITQTHHLQVFVPPDIVDAGSSSEVMVREGDNVTLHCAASGTPSPTITWRREDSADFRVGLHNVSKWSGEWLNMSGVTRDMNGALLCIATNGIPPTVSKRILLHVLCKPSVQALHKLVGGYLGDVVDLSCNIEANPVPSVYWTHINGNRLQLGSKYQASIKSRGFRHNAILRVWNVSREDIGAYCCHVDNPLGRAKDDITLYTLATTSTTSTTEVTEMTTAETTVTTSTQLYVELELDEGDPEFSKDNYVVVLSQHQMQNLDLSPSS